MPVIRISNETMERLKKWAEPLEDTTETAFVKVLDTAEKTLDSPRSPLRPKKPEAVRPPRQGNKQDKLPEMEFRRPLLETLYEMGGKARVNELRPVLEKRLAPRLRSGDYEPVSTGDPRWWNAACWARNGLKTDGYLRSDSPRGLWELSEKGMHQVEAWSAKEPESFIDHLLAMPSAGEDSDFDRPRSGPRRIEI